MKELLGTISEFLKNLAIAFLIATLCILALQAYLHGYRKGKEDAVMQMIQQTHTTKIDHWRPNLNRAVF